MNEPTLAEPAFREVQLAGKSKAFLPGIIGAAVAVSVIWILASVNLYRHHADETVRLDWSILPMAAISIPGVPLLAVMIWHCRLVTEIRDDGLHLRYHWLFVNRLIPYEQIIRCEARTYRPIMEYGGWGVRWTLRKGKAYNVYGNRGVQLVLANGKFLLIGSQQANELAAAISAHLS